MPRRAPTKSDGKRLLLFCDGAARGNPGPAAYGYVVFEGDVRVAADGQRLGLTTNNVAEYEGLLHGLRECLNLGATEVTVKSDSELLVRQLSGRYKVHSPRLTPLYEEARTLLKEFAKVEILHVPRAENSAADAMANEALDRVKPR